MDDVGDDAFEVPIAFSEVQRAESGGALSVVGMGLENGPCSLTLSSDYTTHVGIRVWEMLVERRRRVGGGSEEDSRV